MQFLSYKECMGNEPIDKHCNFNKSDINPATGQPYAVNPATGVWDDNYWSNVVEPQLKNGTFGGGSGGGDYGLQTIIDAFQKQQDERNKIVNEFNAKNPFVYDDVLAQKTTQATEQLDPYYTQTLTDFLTGINTTRSRGLEDQTRLLSQLSQDTSTYTERSKADLGIALQKSAQGSADAGLYDSGNAQRNLGLIKRQSNQSLQDYLTNQTRKAEGINLDTTRNLQDLALQESQGRRDINTNRQFDINTFAQQMTQDAGIQREYALRQALGPLADNNTGDVLAGLTG